MHPKAITVLKFIKAMNPNVRYASGFVLIVALWMISGAVGCSEETAKMDTTANDLRSVTIHKSSAEPYTRMLTLYGRSEAKVQAKVSAQTDGEVAALVKNTGDLVEANDSLLRIDIGTRKSELSAAKAALKEARVLYNSARKLSKEGFKSATTLAQREAQLETAKQNVAQIEKDLEYTNVQSPVKGRVEERMVSEGDYVQAGDQLFTVIGHEKYLLVGYASQKDQSQIQVGKIAKTKLANGQEVEGIVTFVSNFGDNNTRTYRVEIEVDGAKFQIPVGMTATINVPLEVTNAHLVPHSSLVLNDEGGMGVRVVMDSKVQFIPLTDFRDTTDGVWLTGLPENIDLIVRGQNAVTTGEKVKAAEEIKK